MQSWPMSSKCKSIFPNSIFASLRISHAFVAVVTTFTLTACGGGGGGAGGAKDGGGGSTRFVDKKGPTPGGSGTLTFSNVTSTSLMLSWTIAKDDHAASAGLQYLVYRSSSDNISTIATAEANGIKIGSFVTNAISKSIGGLASGGTYYFNVIVKDPSGNKSIYKSKAQTTIANAPLTPSLSISSRVFKDAFTVTVSQNVNPDIDFQEFRYSTNGVVPADCNSGLATSGTINISGSSTLTLKVIACDETGLYSAPVTGVYTYDNTAPLLPSLSPATRVFNTGFSVILSQNVTPDANFLHYRYTTGGSPPADCNAGLASTGSISISGTSPVTLNVIACDVVGNASSPVTGTYTYDGLAPLVPQLDISSRVFNAGFTVTATENLTTDANFLNFRYTINGANPTCSTGSTTSGAINISGTSNATLRVVSCDAAGNVSPVTTGNYTYDGLAPSIPSINIASKAFNADFLVNVTQNATSDANFRDFHYTLNGAAPTCSTGTATSGSISITGTSDVVLRVLACDLANNGSPVATATYSYDITAPSVPSISIPTRIFNAGFSVSASQNVTTDPNFLHFRYTINGADPVCTTGTSTAGSINIASGASASLKVVSCDSAGNVSPIALGTYTFDATAPLVPSIDTPNRNFNSSFTVNVSENVTTDTNWVDFRYHTNGTTPANCSSGTTTSGSINISGTSTVDLRVISCDAAGNASPAANRTYTYDITPPAVPGVNTAARDFNLSFNVQLTHAGGGDFDELRYTLTGVAPTDCNDGISIQPAVNILIAAGTTQVLNAIACDNIDNASAPFTVTYTYDIAPPAVPGVNAADGKFNTTFNVQLTHLMAEPDFNELRYTLTGVAPTNCTDGIGIQPAVNISIAAGSTRVLNAVSCDDLGNISATVTRTYTYDATAPAIPGVNTANLDFRTTFNVQLTHAAGGDFVDLRYTLDGTAPANCSAGISILPDTDISIASGSTKVLNAISCDDVGNASAPVTRTYTYDGTAPAVPGVDTPSQSFKADINVQLTHAMGGDFLELRYKLDGDTPDCSNGTAIQPNVNILITGEHRSLHAISCDVLGNASAPVTRMYLYDDQAPAIPGVNTPARNFNTSFNVRLTHVMAEGDFDELRYTLTGTAPTDCNDGIGIQPNVDISIDPAVTRILKAVSCDDLDNISAEVSVTYTYDITPPAVPGVNTADSDFNTTFNVQLTHAAGGDFQELRYTLTGVAPANCSDGIAIQPGNNISITSGSTKVLNAISCDQIGNASAAVTRTYTFDNVPPAVPGVDTANLSFNVAFDVQLTHAAGGDFNQLRYTLTGTAPTGCSDGISIQPANNINIPTGSTIVLNAISCDNLGNASAAVTRTYTYDITPPQNPTISINTGAIGTQSTTVNLALAADDVDEMYVTNDSGCATGGSYEAFNASKVWVIGQTNATATVYVKYKDTLDNETGCLSDTIIHDTIDPLPPSNLVETEDPYESLSATPILTWTAGSDAGSGISHYEIAVGSTPGDDDMKTWTNVGSGTTGQVTGLSLVDSVIYYTTIRAVDHAGLVSTASDSDGWEARTPPCPVGYVPVPGNGTLGTADFCVMKYEAKNVSNVATSQPSLSPWVSIARGVTSATAGSAWKACTDLGAEYDLITNAQWQTIARNIENHAPNWSMGIVGGAAADSINRGNTDDVTQLAASASDANGCFGIVTNGDPDDDCGGVWHVNDRIHRLSNGQMIWDIAGNVSEWVQDDNTTPQGFNSQVAFITSPTYDILKWGTTVDYSATKNFGEYGGFGYSFLSYSDGAISRGSSGVFSADLSPTPTSEISTVGFRCVFEP